LPITISRKCAYADDLAVTHADGDWQAVEGVLSKDMATIAKYPQTGLIDLNQAIKIKKYVVLELCVMSMTHLK